jgi:hypothetical protein
MSECQPAIIYAVISIITFIVITIIHIYDTKELATSSLLSQLLCLIILILFIYYLCDFSVILPWFVLVIMILSLISVTINTLTKQ